MQLIQIFLPNHRVEEPALSSWQKLVRTWSHMERKFNEKKETPLFIGDLLYPIRCLHVDSTKTPWWNEQVYRNSSKSFLLWVLGYSQVLNTFQTLLLWSLIHIFLPGMLCFISVRQNSGQPALKPAQVVLALYLLSVFQLVIIKFL